MQVPIHRLVATATRLAVLTSTHGATHAVADALAPLIERFFRMSPHKVLVPAALLVSLMIVTRPALSQPPGADPEAAFVEGGLTSAQAAARARAASPSVTRKLAELDAAAANLTAAEQLRVPALTTKLSYTRLSAPDLGGAGELARGAASPAVIRDLYDAQAQLVVPLSDYFVRFPGAIGAAKAGKRAAAVGVQASQADAAIRGRHAYYEWVRARLQLAISGRQLAQVRANLAQMQALVAVKRIARAELLRVEAQEAEAEQGHDRLRELAALREEMLRLQIGAGADEPLAIGEDLRAEVVAPAPVALDALVDTAAKRRLDVRALELGVEATEQRRRAESARALPQLSAFAVTDYARPNARAVVPAEEFGWSWSAGVQLSWSLPDALASRTSTQRLAADARALRADREIVLQNARIEVLSAQQGVHLARQAMTTSQKGLVAAEETYRVRAALLAAERATAVELVDAQTTLTRARIAALDARIDLRIAIAELDHALGTDTTP